MKDRGGAARPPFVYWACLWASGVAFAIVAAVYDALRPIDLTPPGRDFANLYTAGKLVLAGQAHLVFDPTIFRLELLRWVGTFTHQNYSYPPHALLIAAPFGIFPYPVAFVLWTAVGAGAFYYAARRVVPFHPALAVLVPAAGINVWVGHYGFFLGALWLSYFQLFATRPILSGACAAALTFKPHMGLFIGLSALASRTVLVSAVIGTLLLVVLSQIAFGGWVAFFSTTFHQQVSILTDEAEQFYFQLMTSAYAAYGGGSIGITIHAAFALSAFFLLGRRRQLDPFSLATATFIVVPYAFVYDMTVACLGFAIVIWRSWGSLTLMERALLTVAFFVPDINMFAPPLTPPILLAALYIQTRPEVSDGMPGAILVGAKRNR